MAPPDSTTLVALFGHLVVLSLLAMGGIFAVMPEMRRVTVTNMGLLTDAQFNASIAIAHAAPGPNMLFVAVVGYQAAGLIGATVALVGLMVPSTTVSYAAVRWGRHYDESRALRAFKAGIAPIVIALLLATSWLLIGQTPGWRYLALAGAAALVVWRTEAPMPLLIGAGAAAGAAGWL